MPVGTMSLDVGAFKGWLLSLHGYLKGDLRVIVLPEELEPLLHHAFFQGKLNGFLTHDTDRHGLIRMYLDGVKVMFTDKLTAGRVMAVVEGLKNDNAPIPNGPNPVFPKPGPGAGPSGGSPIHAMEAAA